jgi:RimJ/RimL family protein N-acetyltransferase
MKNKKINIPELFKLENVTLKRTEKSFAQERVKVLHENLEHVLEFLKFADSSYSIEDEYNYIESCAEKWNEGKTFDFSVFENSTGKYIGSVSVMVKSKIRGEFEYGYWLAKGTTGKGYMTQIIKALTQYLKTEYDPYRIIIRCNDSNLNSAGVALRNDFLFEGRGFCGDLDDDYYTFVKIKNTKKAEHLKSIQQQLKQLFELKI